MDFNVMFSQRGHLTLAHSDRAAFVMANRAEVNRLQGIDSRLIGRDEIQALAPSMNIREDATYPVQAALYHPPGGIIRHDAVVWAAGAGGGNPGRTRAVDRDAAIRSMDAAATAGVRRYVMVSYFGAGPDHAVPEDNAFFAYADAKSAADAHLEGSGLDWTILRPSRLTHDAPTGRIETSRTGAEPGSVSRAEWCRRSSSPNRAESASPEWVTRRLNWPPPMTAAPSASACVADSRTQLVSISRWRR